MSNNNFTESFYYILIRNLLQDMLDEKSRAFFFESLEFTTYSRKGNADKI